MPDIDIQSIIQSMDFVLIGLFLATGMIAGVLAGFLGIGGGLVVVPLLTIALPIAGFAPEKVMVVAIGTSLATIVFTAISSTNSHRKRHNVVWPAVFSLFPGLMFGAMLGATLGSQMSNEFLAIFFGCFCALFGVYTVWGKRYLRPVADYAQSRGWLSLIGLFTGLVSSLVGIGGGTMLGPALIWLGLEARRAVGTSATCGLLIAVFGSLSYLISGANETELPKYTVGYIYLPALFGIIATSVLFAPLGAKMASYFSEKIIRSCLGIALLASAVKMFISL
ncbi:sulfite exporter TauE/SafE family protein [Catenovulum sp. 2E275]|uniref:sulfite exporter TauE/SafE family protein n=1 Tax=Catenovulum sp. 2E275 TaxID=2980497 RepID=UPI0021D2E28A|nr:sulfite exporter TauE/SafE family protein [Catenovulum sp. 2E275]MCU4677217.1 sulfite exporter TauE/SafE family protein [Catenovulum sp. 2E275]